MSLRRDVAKPIPCLSTKPSKGIQDIFFGKRDGIFQPARISPVTNRDQAISIRKGLELMTRYLMLALAGAVAITGAVAGAKPVHRRKLSAAWPTSIPRPSWKGRSRAAAQAASGAAAVP